MRTSLQQLLAEYGRIALAVYLVIFLAALVGAWVAIHLGWQPESATGGVGAFTAAYLVTKVSQPIRIAVTVALTPLVARTYRRFHGVARRVEPTSDQLPAEAPPAAELPG